MTKMTKKMKEAMKMMMKTTKAGSWAVRMAAGTSDCFWREWKTEIGWFRVVGN